MTEILRGDLQLPASVVLGAMAAAAYLLAYVRHRQSDFTLVDVLILVAIMGIVTSVAMPFFASAGDSARATVLRQNLRTLREKIELYKVEHGGEVPLLFEGTLPQLTRATNAKGVPGPAGDEYPYGPYLPGGIPANPYTGVPTVELVDTFPPTVTTRAGGWLYCQETGQIAPDLGSTSQNSDQ